MGRNARIDRPVPALRRSFGFLLIFALANAGGVIAYLPVLTLLLPMHVELVAGPARLGVLAATVIAGGIAASGANILFGWLSDSAVARGGGRRAWAAGGLGGVAAGCLLVASAHSALALVAGVVAFQIGVNALLAPLLAIMADEVPDDQKGVAGGLLAVGFPIASGVAAALLIGTGSPWLRFAMVPMICAACVLPLLLTRARPAAAALPVASRTGTWRDPALIWLARLLVQIAGNVLFHYLLYYFESLQSDTPTELMAQQVGRLGTLTALLPLPFAVLAGRLSDRSGRRKPFLLAAALVAALGIGAMAAAESWAGGVIAFAIYAIGSGVFLALHAAWAMQQLPSPRHRGRDLGVLNLTNTLPALIGPLLAWRLATPHNFAPLMLTLAALTLAGGVTIFATQRRQ